jgi:tetratricopeptide (TPR) repeat protein
MRTLASILAASIAMASAITLGIALERREAIARQDHRDIVYLPPPWLVRSVALGFHTLAADYYWMQALQYYGNTAHREVDFRDLHRYVGLVVELDPDFEYAYLFGGTTISYNRGPWDWQNVAESNAILEKGVARFPENWRMWLQLGFNRSVLSDEYDKGAEAYRQAALTAGPPVDQWIRSLVSRLHATSGNFARARAHVEEVLSHTDDPHTRETMERRLLELDTEERLQGIERAVADYRQRHGRLPEGIEALVHDGILEQIPSDPLGGEIHLMEDGTPYSTALHGGRLRAFTHPFEVRASQQR